MHEISQAVIEVLGVVAAGLGSLWAQRRAGRRTAGAVPNPSEPSSLRRITLQLEVLDAMIEARCEPAVRAQRDDEEHRDLLRRVLLDIADLVGMPTPPDASVREEPIEFGHAAALAGPVLVDPDSSPTERARIFLSTGEELNGRGGSFWIDFIGNRGRQGIAIASGTSQSDIITALQHFGSRTGVIGIQDPVNPALIRITSVNRGPRQFVAAKRRAGNLRNALLDENRENHADEQFDYGA